MMDKCPKCGKDNPKKTITPFSGEEFFCSCGWSSLDAPWYSELQLRQQRNGWRNRAGKAETKLTNLYARIAGMELNASQQDREIKELRAAIGVPEIYAGVITRVLEDERDELVTRVIQQDKDIEELLKICKECRAFVSAAAWEYPCGFDEDYAVEFLAEIDYVLNRSML